MTVGFTAGALGGFVNGLMLLFLWLIHYPELIGISAELSPFKTYTAAFWYDRVTWGGKTKRKQKRK